MPEPLIIFTPQAIAEALERLSDEETMELDHYARQGSWNQYCERATAWLLARGFSGRTLHVSAGGTEHGPS
jgi:hypothetical protein